MTIEMVVSELRRRSIKLQNIGGELDIYGKPEMLDPPIIELIKRHKKTLLKLLDGRDVRQDRSTIGSESKLLVELTQAEMDCLATVIPGGAANIQDIYPLFPLQEGMLFHYQMSQAGDAYLESHLMAFDTRARVEAFIAALQSTVQRHEIFRTSIAWENLREPVQVVWRNACLKMEELALESDHDVEAQLRRRFDPSGYRLDVQQAPMLRVFAAWDAAKDRWLLVVLLHHLVSDHTTLHLIRDEIQAHWDCRLDRLPRPTPLRNLLAQARLRLDTSEHEEFFRKMLGAVNEPTAPFNLTDTQGDGYGVEEARIVVDPKLSIRLRESARNLGVSGASIAHLAWGLVLARLTGKEQVVFGTVLFGRMQGGEGFGQAMGLFINTLPLKINVDESGVASGVRNTHRLLTDLIHHEQASLALAQRCSGLSARAPLFTSLLNYRHSQKMGPSQQTTQMWEGVQLLSTKERTNYPLTVSVDDLGEGFLLTAQTVKQVQPMRLCRMMHVALDRLADALETDPTLSLRCLDILPDEERALVIEKWNATEGEYKDEACVHELFQAQVVKNPGATAVVHGEQQLTYGELNERANRLAHRLRSAGVKPDSRVAICVERSLEMVIGLLAVLKAGGAYVPLDPNYPVERIRYMLENCDPVVLLTQNTLQRSLKLDDAAAKVLILDLEQQFDDQPTTNIDAHEIGLKPNHLAYVIFTSGSTGMPKGVLVEHRNLTRLFASTLQWFHFDETDVWPLFHSYAFDFSVWEIWGALLYGGRLVIVPHTTVRSPEDFYALICREGVTILNQTPSAFRQLVRAQGQSDGKHRLRVVVFGGEALEPASLKSWFDQNEGIATALINMYGITETTVHVTYRPLSREDMSWRGGSPIGHRIPDLQIYILDARGQPAPIGVAGELYIGGAGVARGYLNRPELTAERFVEDRFSGNLGARLYKTGDLGRWLPDGNIEFLGRNDFQVKIRGFRIELGEIEAKLAEHEHVREAIVVAREESTGEKRLVGYVITEGEVSAESLRTHVASSLPDYMVPAAFVRMLSFPLTQNGKLDRKALPEPGGDAYAVRVYEAPQGEVEIKIAAIWSELLQVERVGRHDNFFELGGSSFSAVKARLGIRESFGIEIPLALFFQHPRLLDQGRLVRSFSSIRQNSCGNEMKSRGEVGQV